MKKFIWAVIIIVVIIGAFTIKDELVFAQDYDGPIPTITQAQVDRIEHGEPVEGLPILTQNWIYMIIGFIIMVAPYLWYYYQWGPGKDKRK